MCAMEWQLQTPPACPVKKESGKTAFMGGHWTATVSVPEAKRKDCPATSHEKSGFFFSKQPVSCTKEKRSFEFCYLALPSKSVWRNALDSPWREKHVAQSKTHTLTQCEQPAPTWEMKLAEVLLSACHRVTRQSRNWRRHIKGSAAHRCNCRRAAVCLSRFLFLTQLGA